MNKIVMTYVPMAPFQRHSATSRAAAKAIEPKAGTQRAIVLAFLRGRGELGATDDEMQLQIPMQGSTQRPRRGELGSLIRDSGKTRKTSSGHPAAVWVAREHCNG